MSKKTHWRFVASNALDTRTKEEKEKYQQKQFKWGLALERMRVNKPSFTENKPFYDNGKKKKQEKETV